MKFTVLTLFPEMVLEGLNHSIIKRGIEAGKIEIEAIDIRDFANNKHNQVDDYAYGGGAGMVMRPQPIYDAYQSIQDKTSETPVIYMSPQGKTFNQAKAKELSGKEHIILLCGHYEGVDERVLEEIVTEEISIGDYVLTGGELAAMAIIDATARLVPGVLNNSESALDESFSYGLLEYPQYTRPLEFLGRTVPEVLLSGHHQNVDKWRHEKALERTLGKRPELLEKAVLTDKDKVYLDNLKKSLD